MSAMQGPDLQGMKCIYETVEGYHPVFQHSQGHCLNCDLLVAKKVGSARLCRSLSRKSHRVACFFFK